MQIDPVISNANDILFRCSSLSHIMGTGGEITEIQLAKLAELEQRAADCIAGVPKVKPLTANMESELAKLIYKRDNPELPAGVKTHLVDLFVRSKYRRKEEVFGKMMNKGNDREEDAITLLSVMTNRYFEKNSTRLRNEFLQGEPDTFIGTVIEKAEETFDTKCSWSAYTHFRALNDELNEDYLFQGYGYMALTGAKRHSVVRCLMNTPANIINDEKRKALYNFDGNAKNKKYIEHCKQLEINHIYDLAEFIKENPDFEFHLNLADWSHDIPPVDRIFITKFDRDEEIIQNIYKRVRKCREWMNKELFKIAE